MADGQNDDKSQNANASPNQDTSKDDGKNSGEGESGKTEKTFTQAELDALIAKRLKEERQRIEKKAREESLSDAEKLKARAEQAEAALRDVQNRDAVVEAAQDAKARSPQKLFRLIKDDLIYDDAGKLINLKETIARAKKDFPDEFGGGGASADGGAGGSAGVKPNMNDIIRRAAGRM